MQEGSRHAKEDMARSTVAMSYTYGKELWSLFVPDPEETKENSHRTCVRVFAADANAMRVNHMLRLCTCSTRSFDSYTDAMTKVPALKDLWH